MATQAPAPNERVREIETAIVARADGALTRVARSQFLAFYAEVGTLQRYESTTLDWDFVPHAHQVAVDLTDLFRDLREAMAAQDRTLGAWFWSRVMVRPGTNLWSYSFGYDDRILQLDLPGARWETPADEAETLPTDADWLLEFDLHPRTRDHTPDWWARIIDGTSRLIAAPESQAETLKRQLGVEARKVLGSGAWTSATFRYRKSGKFSGLSFDQDPPRPASDTSQDPARVEDLFRRLRTEMSRSGSDGPWALGVLHLTRDRHVEFPDFTFEWDFPGALSADERPGAADASAAASTEGDPAADPR